MRRSALLVAALLGALVLSGCSGSTHSAPGGPTGHPADLTTQATVVHRKDGEVVAASLYPGELPRMAQRYVANRTSGEPTIGVTAKGQVIYPSIAFDALPADPMGATGNVPKTNIYISADQGATWTDRSPAANQARTSPVSLDPFVYADPVTGRLFNVDLYVACANLQFTDDGGGTWLSSPLSCGIPVDDHQSLAAGPVRPPLVPNPLYPRALYYCVNQLAVSSCTHSLDGGLTWTAAATPAFGGASTSGETQGLDPCGGLTGHVHASEVSGTVFLPAGCIPSGGSSAANGQAEVSRSTDNGATWTPIIVDRHDGFDGHDGSVAVDAKGTVYYFFLDGHQLPRLAVSHDDGLTWSPALNVTGPGVTTAKFPAITAGAAGRVAFLYVGSTTPHGSHYSDRTDCGKQACPYAHPDELHNATWNAYVGFSLDADQPDPVFATTQVNDPADPLARGDCDGRCYREPNDGMFDFLDIQTNPATGQVYASLVDQCVQKCAQPGGKDTDLAPGRGAVGVQVGGTLLGSVLPR